MFLAGRTDSSGLRLHHRPAQPGQHDVGTLTTGVQPGYVDYNIPPKAAHFRTYGVCNTTVFPQVWDGSQRRADFKSPPSVDGLFSPTSQHVKPIPDLQVFAVMPHTHLVGRKVRAAHYRWESCVSELNGPVSSNPAWLQFLAMDL